MSEFQESRILLRSDASPGTDSTPTSAEATAAPAASVAAACRASLQAARLAFDVGGGGGATLPSGLLAVQGPSPASGGCSDTLLPGSAAAAAPFSCEDIG
jgi:hypothetical protein